MEWNRFVGKLFSFLVWIQYIANTRSEGCLDPGPIENGSRDPPPSDHYLPKNSVIRYNCSENYTLKGATKVYCGVRNQWYPKNSLPECIPNIYCENPQIENGEVTGTTPSGHHDHYLVNTDAHLSCFTGFTVTSTGEIVNRCGPDGLWFYSWAECQDIDECMSNICQHGGSCVNLQGSYKCNCLNQYEGVNCEKGVIHGCSEPFNVTNASKEFSEEPSIFTGYYYVGTHVTYTCKTGYKMTGSSSLICTDGQWEGEYPICRNACSPPPIVPHSSYAPKQTSYSSGEQVIYACEDGFYRVGIDRVTCGSGNWTGTGQTTCIPQHHCPNPGKPEHGDHCCQDIFIPGVKISFYCDANYELVGTEEITCQSNGQWDSDLDPLCVLVTPEEPDSGNHMLTNETFTIVVAISGSIMGILTVTIILSVRECCTQRRRRPRCRYHSSSLSARVARMRDRRHSHLLSLTSNMEVALPSYEEAIGGSSHTSSGHAAAHETQRASSNDAPPELPPRPPQMMQVPPQTTESRTVSADNSTSAPLNRSPPVQRSSRIPPWRRRRRASHEQQSANSEIVGNSSELNEISHSSNQQESQDSDEPLIDVVETQRNDADMMSLESGVISDQQDEDGSGISAIAGELTPSGSSESLSTFEGIPLQQTI